jgi:cytochrome P450
MFGFIVAAHDTTATTIAWTLKLLADYQDAQNKLRSSLHAAFSTAKGETRPPTHREIVKTAVPHLDAVIEEALPYASTATTILRTTTQDVEILGHVIPKTTEIYSLSQGPSIFSPTFSIPDSLRSESVLAAKDRIGSWDPQDMGQPNPERWLREENGKEVFDAASGLLLTFGLGPRGCYGRRPEYLEMRLILVLLVWGFELQRCPEGLSGWGRIDNLTSVPDMCYVRLRKL